MHSCPQKNLYKCVCMYIYIYRLYTHQARHLPFLAGGTGTRTWSTLSNDFGSLVLKGEGFSCCSSPKNYEKLRSVFCTKIQGKPQTPKKAMKACADGAANLGSCWMIPRCWMEAFRTEMACQLLLALNLVRSFQIESPWPHTCKALSQSVKEWWTLKLSPDIFCVQFGETFPWNFLNTTRWFFEAKNAKKIVLVGDPKQPLG